MDYEFYTIHGNETSLPIYVECIGHYDKQHHIIRENGFMFNQVIYSTKGKAVVIFNNKRFVVESNTGIFIPAYVPHEYYAISEEWNTNCVAFGGYGTKKMLENLDMKSWRIDKLSDISKLSCKFQQIYLILKNDRLFGNYQASGYLYEFLIEYYRIITKKVIMNADIDKCPLSPIFDYIDLHYKEGIMLEDLCSIINVSPQHLCRLFKKYLQLRPNEYIARKRLSEAKRMLLYTEKKIYEIAKETGFKSTDYFTTVFKKYERMLPSEFRRLTIK